MSGSFHLSFGVTNGIQEKFMCGNKYAKRDIFGCCQGLAELMATQMMDNLNLPFTYFHYTVGRDAEATEAYCLSDYYPIPMITLSRLLQDAYSQSELEHLFDNCYAPVVYYDNLLRSILDITGLDASKYLSYLMFLDCLTLNTDRHWGNICFTQDNKGKYAFSPYFDFGAGYLSSAQQFVWSFPGLMKPVEVAWKTGSKMLNTASFAESMKVCSAVCKVMIRYKNESPVVNLKGVGNVYNEWCVQRTVNIMQFLSSRILGKAPRVVY